MSAPDPAAGARRQAAGEALDALRDAMEWRRAELWQRFHWIKQDPASRDPYDTRAARLLDQLDGLRIATDELHYQRFQGAWDRERVYMRERFERGEA